MKKSLVIACGVMLATAATMTAIYVKQSNDKQQQEESQLAVVDTEEMLGMVVDTETGSRETPEEVTAADSILVPDNEDVTAEKDAVNTEEEDTEQLAETAADSDGVVLHFSEESSVNWPLQGTVLMNYSMDHTVYYATLDQYKYNPAVIIGCNVNDRVNCAVDGVVTDISTNEVTGCTVTMDIGDGYSVIYGQLKQVPYEEGTLVMQGSLVGYVAEPTKYYSEEGCNLYFAMEKDGVPVDPASFFE